MISEKELTNLLDNVSKIIGVQYTTDNLENNTCNADVLIDENTVLCIFSKHINDAIDEKKQSLLLKMLENYKNEKKENVDRKLENLSLYKKPTASEALATKIAKGYQLYEPSNSATNLRQKLDRLQRENEIANQLNSNQTLINSDSPLMSNAVTTVDYSSNDQLIEQSLDTAYNEYKTYWTDVRKAGMLVVPQYSSQSIEPGEEFVPVETISRKVLNPVTGEYIEQILEKPTKTRRNVKTS